MKIILKISLQEVIHATDKKEYKRKREELWLKLRKMGLKPLIEDEYEIK